MVGLTLMVVFIIGYALISKYLAMTPITGPIVFVAFGLLVGPDALNLVTVELNSQGIQWLLEGTLVVILFTDAAIIDIRAVAKNLFVPGRLLTLGLILTIAAGIAAAAAMFGDLGFWGAAVVAVVLAPTDAALGQAVVTNERVPPIIRQGLSVESGLNDGIVVPFLAIAIAGAAGEMQTATEVVTLFAQEIGIAVIVGLAVGLIGGKLVVLCFERGWMTREWRQVSVPLLAGLCFLITDPLHGSGFIAAFVGGLAFGKVVREKYPDVCSFSEAIAYLLTMVSFFVFGAVLLGPRLTSISWEIIAYAALSLTVVRMVPVAIAMIGSKLDFRTVAYTGWFGPRGVASLVFVGTVVVEARPSDGETILIIVATTVAMSVLLHGLSAWPLSNLYGRWYQRTQESEEPMVESVEVEDVAVRSRVTESQKAFGGR
jgi:NhaP-type Na+/H+ or K+/H+ antiporter